MKKYSVFLIDINQERPASMDTSPGSEKADVWILCTNITMKFFDIANPKSELILGYRVCHMH